jgi:hypothetical protein
MKTMQTLAVSFMMVLGACAPTRVAEPVRDDFRKQFFELCDMAAAQLSAGQHQKACFIDSYAVRALCVAYDGPASGCIWTPARLGRKQWSHSRTRWFRAGRTT